MTASHNSLYTKGRILGHKRGKRNSRPNQSLVQIEGVDSKEAARHYLGKVSRGFGLIMGGHLGVCGDSGLAVQREVVLGTAMNGWRRGVRR